MTPTNDRTRIGSPAGFTIIELVVSMAIMVAILGAVMGSMTQALRANQTAIMVTGMNSNLRTAMDVMIRDLLQVGQDLPVGRVILIPNDGTLTIKLPGPPGTASTTAVTDTELNAVMPGPGLGPVVNGVATDIIRTLAADSSFSNVDLSGLSDTTMTVTLPPSPANPAINGIDLSISGVTAIHPGDLIMLTKGATSTLLEVTAVSGQVVTFADGDSLGLNRSTVNAGSLHALNLTVPDLPTQAAAAIQQTQAYRIRMITYYIDATISPSRPRLVRRMNNGNATTFNNSLGSVVAFDVETLQITYDIADGATNPTGVRMVSADLLNTGGTGACNPNVCSPNQIRNAHVTLTGRSSAKFQPLQQFFRNSLTSQVSLRSLAFVDKYTSVPE